MLLPEGGFFGDKLCFSPERTTSLRSDGAIGNHAARKQILMFPQTTLLSSSASPVDKNDPMCAMIWAKGGIMRFFSLRYG